MAADEPLLHRLASADFFATQRRELSERIIFAVVYPGLHCIPLA